MTWGILLALVGLVLFMSLVGRQQVAWVNKMRRVNAGTVRRAEWMAPERVVHQVQDDYLTAAHWLPGSVSQAWATQWRDAELYLSGLCLKRHLEILKGYQMGQPTRFVGVMQCEHEVTVRHFSDDGETCLVLDTQRDRQMQTLDFQTHRPVMTQALPTVTVVYQMRYHKSEGRWKIDRFIQELPLGWSHRPTGAQRGRIHLLSALPPSIGRDH